MDQMTNSSEEQGEKTNMQMNWQNAADAQRNSVEWFGAIIRYFGHLGRKKFDTFYKQNDLKKNVAIGWLFQIMVLLIIIYIGYRLS